MTPEQRQAVGLDCINCGELMDGTETGEPRCCKICWDEIANACPECHNVDVVQCPAWTTGDCDEACPTCNGEGVVDCPRLAEHTTVVVTPAAEWPVLTNRG